MQGVHCQISLIAEADIDNINKIRYLTGNNGTDPAKWSRGSFPHDARAAWDGDVVGLTACAGINSSIPIRLWYAADSTTFEEYLWHAEDDQWELMDTWRGYSGASSVGCWNGNRNESYVGLVNLNNALTFWYYSKQGGDTSEADWRKGWYILLGPSKAELTLCLLI